MRNALCLLLLSHGTPMIVAGDEFARTQGGNNNPYNQDNPTSWIDWARASAGADQQRFLHDLLAIRAAHPVVWQSASWGVDVEWFGTVGSPDVGDHSRSIAWHIDGLYVMANMWWEPLQFDVQVAGPWQLTVDTMRERVTRVPLTDTTVEVGPRSIVVLTR